MRIQSKSQGWKYGDTNKDHALAVKRVIDFSRHFKHKDWIIDTSWVEQYSEKFKRENPNRNKTHWGHTPDLVFYEWFVDRPVLKLVIEVDGPSHDKTERKLSDKLFERWIGKRYGGFVPVIRLNVRELVGDLDLSVEYLQKELKEYIDEPKPKVYILKGKELADEFREIERNLRKIKK